MPGEGPHNVGGGLLCLFGVGHGQLPFACLCLLLRRPRPHQLDVTVSLGLELGWLVLNWVVVGEGRGYVSASRLLGAMCFS